MKKLLIVYFTYSNGNTAGIAERLAEATGGDLESLEPVKPYLGGYDAVVKEGQREVEAGEARETRPLAHDVSSYDAIAVGSPTWWYTMAPAVLDFLRKHDLSGKYVIPFVTNGGWPGHAIKDIEAAAGGAKALLPLAVQFDSEGGPNQVTPDEDVRSWMTKVRNFLSQ
jgi:flavodoxin